MVQGRCWVLVGADSTGHDCHAGRLGRLRSLQNHSVCGVALEQGFRHCPICPEEVYQLCYSALAGLLYNKKDEAKQVKVRCISDGRSADRTCAKGLA